MATKKTTDKEAIEPTEKRKGAGRPPLVKELKDKKICVCMRPSTFKILEKKAAKNGMPTSTFVNYLLMKYCGTFDDEGGLFD